MRVSWCLPSCLYRPVNQTPSWAPESGCSDPMNVTHWPPSALPLNCTTGTPFLLAATMDAEDAFRLAASKARQLTPCASMLSTFFSSFSVSLKASVSRHFTPRALHAACAAFWRAATYGHARVSYDTPKD